MDVRHYVRQVTSKQVHVLLARPPKPETVGSQQELLVKLKQSDLGC